MIAKYVFIDMDNTIAENKTCNNVEFTTGLYINKRPAQSIIDAICTVYQGSVFIVISATQGNQEGAIEKKAWLQLYAKDFCQHEPFLLTEGEPKEEVIRDFCVQNNICTSECVLIDDKKDILQAAERHGIIPKYPLQVLCDYEALKAEKSLIYMQTAKQVMLTIYKQAQLGDQAMFFDLWNSHYKLITEREREVKWNETKAEQE